MKRIIRTFLIDTTSLYLASSVASGMEFNSGFVTLLMAGGALAFVTIFIKPITKILLLPLNLITFGLFKWVTAVVTLYVVDLVVPGFSINFFDFPGYHSSAFSLPAIHTAGFTAYFSFSIVISVVHSLFFWLIH